MNYDKSLVGKYVIVSIAILDLEGNFRMTNKKAVRTITKITRKGFQISGSRLWFDFDGFQKHKQTKMDDRTTTYCMLITEKDVAYLEAKWLDAKERNAIKKGLTKEISKLQQRINKI